MRVFKFFICIFLLHSCKDQGKINSDVSKKRGIGESELSQDLYVKLIDYQKLYPFPKNADGDLYVYEAVFYKINGDTIMSLRRSGGGIRPRKGEKIMGVYSDSNLALTVIRDSLEYYSKNFINKVIVDSIELNKLKPLPDNDYSETYPPVYKFRVTGGKLILNGIDTVWVNWRK